MELLVGLVLFVIAIVALTTARRATDKIDALERLQENHRDRVVELERRIRAFEGRPAGTAATPAAAAAPSPAPAATERPATAVPPTAPAIAPRPSVQAPAAASAVPPVEAPPVISAPPPRSPAPPRVVPPPSPPPPPAAPRKPIDWESLLGARLIPVLAAFAIVIAAVFFLKLAIDKGWLAPPMRVAIGIATGIGLLLFCERKAARRYVLAANALDAAAIAVLFSTFFSAHTLWHLISGPVAFGLLALVAVVGVLLSIRRESLFIAILGLVGGFLTPALLSTGQNQPIALFSYLFLLNLGLAWVAYRKRWPVLTVLSVILTTLYQWGWVIKFLHDSPLPLAMGVFLIFPALTVAGMVLGNSRREPGGGTTTFEMTGLVATTIPLAFGLYLAAVPEYGARAELLFGFLAIIDAGLLAVAIARREERLHVVAAAATLLVVAIWLGLWYSPGAWTIATGAIAALSMLYLIAPAIAARAGRPFGAVGLSATFAAPLLLAAFAFLARADRAGSQPWLVFGILFALAVLIGWRAIASRMGPLHFVSAFMVLVALASWSDVHLMTESLRTAVALYAAFGLLALGVPVSARRVGKPLEPAAGSGIVLVASLVPLLFLAWSPVAPAAVWGLALLLAILNAAVFIESAAGRMAPIAMIGGGLSWFVLGIWWWRAAAIVGLLPSLLIVILLSLVMLAGYAWAHASTPAVPGQPAGGTVAVRFRDGLFLGLIGHLFLVLVATNPAWSVPPAPLFGALAVLTLAVSVVSVFTGAGRLHAAGITAAGIVIAVWVALSAAGSTTALLAAGAVSAFAIVWIGLARNRPEARQATGIAAALGLFAGEATAIIATGQADAMPLHYAVAAHVINFAALLVLAWRFQWRAAASVAALVASVAMLGYAGTHDDAIYWQPVIILSAAIYLVFIVYPFALASRSKDRRDPYLAAVIVSGVFLLVARMAFERGNMLAFVGIVPVVEGAVMAVLLRQLLRMEPSGARDMGRLALVAGAALALLTIAIPLQLDEEWITIGWALEGAALAWLATRVPHRGLMWTAAALLAVVFVRLALNPDVFYYHPRGALRIFNWYLYTYAVGGAALMAGARWLQHARLADTPSFKWVPKVLTAAGVVLLFLLLNIEIADFYATGPEITFQLGVTLAQDLTYTIGWLAFGLIMLAVGIITHHRAVRLTALALVGITTVKCFLYDLRSLGGMYRVGSLVGLAISLALVSIALQKYVLSPSSKQKELSEAEKADS